MRASDIAISGVTIGSTDTVETALRVMAENSLPGVIMVDGSNRPRRVIPGTQVLRMAIPDSFQGDPALVRAVDEGFADEFWVEQDDRTVGECVPRGKEKPGKVPRDATLLEVAVVMADLHTPLVAVVDDADRLIGTVTLSSVLTHLTLPTPPG